MRARVTFHAQEWVRDYAIDVDPRGETTWLEPDVSPDVRDDTRESDALRSSASAPEWVREWSGPFYVTIEWLPSLPSAVRQ